MMIKKRKSFIVLVMLAFIFNMLPVLTPPALAADNSVTIRNTYTNFQRNSKTITIEDNDIFPYSGVGLSLETWSYGWKDIANPTVIAKKIVQSTLDKSWNLQTAMVTGTCGWK